MKRGLGLSGLFFAAILIISYSGVAASVIQKTVDFQDPEIGVSGAFSTVSIKGCLEVGLPGQPLLPAYGMSILLPQGHEVAGVRVATSNTTEFALEYPLEWAKQQYPLSMEGPYEQTLADEDIYGGEDAFPAEQVVHVSTEVFRGYSIAFLRVYPAVYAAANNALIFSSRIDITVDTRPSEEELMRSIGSLRAGNRKDVQRLAGMVEDIAEARSYEARSFPAPLASIVDASETYPYVIITNSTLESAFENLKDLKDEQGYRTKIVLVSDITSNYSGDDTQMKIRNFIIDAYQNWETEFVLFGGDDEIIPHRGLYADAGGTTDSDIAADLYYMGLDGNWNTDGDSFWGEVPEADLVPEISSGRAAVSTLTEANYFVDKMIKYQRTPVTGDIENALMLGELLWSDPTWGGDYKDEIKDGASTHGYTTAGFPGNFTVTTLYDRDIAPAEWDKYDLFPLLNGGQHIVNHLGHCNTTYGLRMVNSDMPSLTADGVSNTYNVIYSQGCYAASFDNRTSSGGYTDDCIGEYLTMHQYAAVAFVGNTRYGWGAHESTRGASQYYDRQFFDAMFAEDITIIGLADVDSRVDNIPFIDATGPGRWVYYELVVLGDPAMDIWTGVPGTVTALLPETIYVGENEVAVRITGSGGVEGARVSIYSDSTYSCELTDADGYAYLDPMALETGELYVSVMAHNFHTYVDTIPVAEATGALLILTDYPVDDDGSGGSSGNADGLVDDGEYIESIITTENIGQGTATDATATLRSGDLYVSVVDSTTSFSSIPAGSLGTASSALVFIADPDVPDGEVIDLEVYLAYSDTAVTRHVQFTAHAPVLAVEGLLIDDSVVGNVDGCLEAGETVELTFTLGNAGSGDAEGATVYLSTSDPYATVLQDESYVANIASEGQAQLVTPFVVQVSPGCPMFHEIDLDLDIQLASGRQAYDTASMTTGGLISDDMESGEGPWTHEVVNDGYVDEWHMETYRNHTGGGTYSWKCGGAGSANYSDYSNGALVTPALCLGPDATLTFWHYMDAETYSGSYTWDGGIVEISTDGGYSWTLITPNGGYPHLIYPNSASPFDGDTPCWGETSGWEQVTFDLSAYTGSAMIRFQFGSDGYTTEEGWYIDDVEVTADLASVKIDPGDMEPLPVRFALRIAGRNPVSGQARVSFDVPKTAAVAVEVFDVQGRVVNTLANSVLEPGSYEMEWDSSKSSPGVYFVRMKTNEFEKVHKIISVR
ncbi:MAG: C25 family cysteine peptidase [bacterium]